MTCAEVREYLFAFLDDELDATLSMELQRHLEGCAECAREAEIEQTVRQRLKASLQPHTPLPDLQQAVIRAGRSPTAKLVKLVLAASVIAAVGLGLRHLAEGRHASLAMLLVQDFEHAVDKPLHLASTDSAEVNAWLREHTDLEVRVQPSHGHCRLLGARRCKLAGHPAAFVLYEMERTPVSLVASAALDLDLAGMKRTTDDSGAWWRERCRGHSVVLRRHGDLIYAAVSTLPEEQLLHFLESMVHESH